MLRTIDKINDVLVQKITKPDGKLLRYQTIPATLVGKTEAVPHMRLHLAREHASTGDFSLAFQRAAE